MTITIAQNAKISGRILAFVTNGGMSLEQAFDTVLGPGYYACMIEELYVELRAKAQRVAA